MYCVNQTVHTVISPLISKAIYVTLSETLAIYKSFTYLLTF